MYKSKTVEGCFIEERGQADMWRDRGRGEGAGVKGGKRRGGRGGQGGRGK